MDFVSDALFNGKRLRTLTVVDAYARECLAIRVDQGIKGEQMVDVWIACSSNEAARPPRSGLPAGLVAPSVIGADVFVIQMASIVKECTLGHSKHRIHRPVSAWSSPSLR